MRPYLSENDVEKVRELAIDFFKHFERDYVQSDERNVHMCKSTIHALLHLSDNIKSCGSLVLCNHFWMERFIGYVKNRLNSTVKAAEGLTEMTKLAESYKLFFHESFAIEEDDIAAEVGIELNGSNRSNEIQHITNQGRLLNPRKEMDLRSRFMVKYSVKELIVRCIKYENEWMTDAEANNWIERGSIVRYGRLEITCGLERVIVGSELCCRTTCTRENWYIAAEFESDDEGIRRVY